MTREKRINKQDITPSNGVLHPEHSEPNYCLNKWSPSKGLSDFVCLFWHVEWELEQQSSHIQKNIPDPCVHLCFETVFNGETKQTQSRIIGPVSTCFERTLSSKGEIFAIKFHPAAFKLLIKQPVSELKDQSFEAMAFFTQANDSTQIKNYLRDMADTSNIQDKINLSEGICLSLLAGVDNALIAKVALANRIVAEINHNSSINTVQQICDSFSISLRQLQRLFNDFIGLSPKWVIRKFRVQDFLARANESASIENKTTDWADLANELGYYDQAHFIKDIKSMIGQTPQQYFSKRL